MGHVVRFRASSPSWSDVAEFLRGRRGYTVGEQSATYLNEETGVDFACQRRAADGDVLPFTFEVAHGRPLSFGLEAGQELRALMDRFALTIADQPGFLAAWNQGNAIAHAARVASAPELPRVLPAWTIEHTWRWNYQRDILQNCLNATDANAPSVAKVTYVDHPAGARRLATAAMWVAPHPTLIPEVDVLMTVAKFDAGPEVRHLPFGDFVRLAGLRLSSGSESFTVNGRSYAYALDHVVVIGGTFPATAYAALENACEKGGFKGVPPADICVEGLTAEAVVMPHLRAVADGAAPRELRIVLFSTSAHRTFTKTITGKGEVLGGEVTKRGEEPLGCVMPEDVRALASMLATSGFPHLRLPPGHRPPSPTIPPVRIEVAVGDLSLSAEIPASETAAVPAFGALIGRIHDLVRRAR